MAALTNTDPNVTYKDLLQLGSGTGTGITSSIQTVLDGAGNSTALGLSTSQVNCASFTFNGTTMNLTSGSITVTPNTTFSGNVSVSGTLSVTGATTLTVPLAVNQGGTGSATASGARTNLVAAASGANGDITSLTGLTGVIKAPTFVQSSAGANILGFNYIGSAVNYLRVNNNVTGQPILLDAVGDASLAFGIRPANADIWVLDSTATIAPGIRYYNAAGTQYTKLKAATSQATSLTLVLPAADTAHGVVQSDGSGNLSIALANLTNNVTGTLPTGNGGTGVTASDPVIQRVSTIVSAVNTGTTTFAFSNSVPTNASGDQYMSLAITPKNSANILVIDVSANVSNSASSAEMGMVLCQDSTVNGLASTVSYMAATNQNLNLTMKHIMTAGTTSSTTFKVRIGGNNAGTTTFNGNSSTGLHGGIMNSYIMITEYAS